MPSTTAGRRTARAVAAGAILFFASVIGAFGQSKTLPGQTRFFIPQPPNGVAQQVQGLLEQGKF